MPAMRRGVVILAPLLLFSSPALGAEVDAAKRHFEAGKRLRDDGDCGKAISEFEKSLEADKSVGAYYNLGFCNEQLGKRQEAYAAYTSARDLASTKKDDRLREISGALAALLETPHVRLALPNPLPEGFSLTIDDERVPASLYQPETVIFTPKTKKAHEVVAMAPGYETRRETVDNKQLKAIELSKPQPKPVVVVKEVHPPDTSWSTGHYLGLGLIGAGAISVTIGGIVGVNYLIKEGNLKDRYNAAVAAKGASSKEAVDLANEYNANEQTARDNTPFVIGAFIGGALLVGGGIFLFVVSPKTVRPAAGSLHLTPSLSPRNAGLSLSGSF